MPEIEHLILANHAEALNGLLYISGGGWTDLWRGHATNETPPSTHFGIGISILVPWSDTTRPHRLALRLENEDGQEFAKMDADFEMGRPSRLPAGSDQRAVLALNVDMAFPAPGGYRIAADLDGQIRTTTFRVHDEPRP